MCGPPQYYPGPGGGVYGWYVYPGFPPWNGAVPPYKNGANFPTHRFARSPRDFFMIDFGPRNPPY
jgi:hypothetical protein